MKQIYVTYDRQKNLISDAFKYCPFCREPLQLVESGRQLRPTCPVCGFIQFRNPAPAVTVLVAKQDQVLLGRRAGSPGANKWSLPSGYIEYDEDFLSTARREVMQETGLNIQIQTIMNVESAFLSPQYHFLTIYLLAHVVGGELQAGDDFTAVAWFPSTGPLPVMAFPQDVVLIRDYAQKSLQGLPVDPE